MGNKVVRVKTTANIAFKQLGQDGRAMGYNRYYAVVRQDNMSRQQIEQSAIGHRLNSSMCRRNTSAPTAQMQPRWAQAVVPSLI